MYNIGTYKPLFMLDVGWKVLDSEIDNKMKNNHIAYSKYLIQKLTNVKNLVKNNYQ